MPPLILPSSLRSLRVACFYEERAHDPDLPTEHPAIEWLIRTLEQGSTTGLEELVLVISVTGANEFENPSELWASASGWSRTLDSLLTGGAYPYLQRVGIIVDCPEKSDTLVSLVDKFTNLLQAGMITICAMTPDKRDAYVLDSVQLMDRYSTNYHQLI